MGPRSDERGNPIIGSRALPLRRASMGPRSDERGNGSRRVKVDFGSVRFNGAAL